MTSGPKVMRVLKYAGRTGSGQPLVLLGLSGENVTRLMADEPITFDLSELGLAPTQVIILGGRREEDILNRLRRQGLLP